MKKIIHFNIIKNYGNENLKIFSIKKSIFKARYIGE